MSCHTAVGGVSTHRSVFSPQHGFAFPGALPRNRCLEKKGFLLLERCGPEGTGRVVTESEKQVHLVQTGGGGGGRGAVTHARSLKPTWVRAC